MKAEQQLTNLNDRTYPFWDEVDKMTDLAEIDLYYKTLPGRRGRPSWRATDELIRPNEGAVRRAAFYVDLFKQSDSGPRNGRHERAVEQAFEYMREKGLRLPRRESLENYLRRAKPKP